RLEGLRSAPRLEPDSGREPPRGPVGQRVRGARPRLPPAREGLSVRRIPRIGTRQPRRIRPPDTENQAQGTRRIRARGRGESGPPGDGRLGETEVKSREVGHFPADLEQPALVL